MVVAGMRDIWMPTKRKLTTNLFPLMRFRLISLYMGSPLSRIWAIIYDHMFPRFPRPEDWHVKQIPKIMFISFQESYIEECIESFNFSTSQSRRTWLQKTRNTLYRWLVGKYNVYPGLLVKSAYQKNNFLISQPKHENIYNFTLRNFVYLNLCISNLKLYVTWYVPLQ